MPTFDDGESGSSVRSKINASITSVDGLGTMSTQNSDSVTITGGSVTGITDLAVADGGTGSSTALDARTALGVSIGSDVQAYDAGLTSIAGLTTAADKMIYTTGSDTYAVADLSAFGRTLVDDADASAARTTLGLGTMATQDLTSVNIDGGSINGTTVGSTSPTAGTFVNLTASGVLKVEANSPTLWLLEADGSSGFDGSRLRRTGDSFSIATFNSTSLISTDYRIRTDASGATEHEMLIGNTERFSLVDAGLSVDGYVSTEAVSVASLPTAASAGAGARDFVTDATATTFASIVAGGGANGVPVYSDGTNWRIG